jgi:hypothetical protein
MRRDNGLKVTALQAQQLLTERETASMLAVSHTTLSTWRCKRRYADLLPWVRIGTGRAIRYRLSDLESFIASGLVLGGGTAGADQAAASGGA